MTCQHQWRHLFGHTREIRMNSTVAGRAMHLGTDTLNKNYMQTPGLYPERLHKTRLTACMLPVALTLLFWVW
jgi:hypothetical protein